MSDIDRKAAEDYYVILKELEERRLKDPLARYLPHPKQQTFIDSVLGEECFENWLIAANRAGKSDGGAYAGSTLARYGSPAEQQPTSGWVVGVDFPILRDVLMPKYFDNGFVPKDCSHDPFIPDREIAEWRVGDNILKLKNGSIIGFKSCESGARKFQGAEKDWIHFDEEPDEDVYTESTIRIGAKKRIRIFGTCTLLPTGSREVGIRWLYSKMIQPFMEGKLEGIKLFGASIYDNPYLRPDEIKRLEAKYPLESIMGRIRLLGEWLPGLAGARAYFSFARKLHVHEQKEYNPRLPLVWTMDFNVEPMVSLIGQKDGDTFRVFKEIVMEEGSIYAMVDAFRAEVPSHSAEIWVYGDASGKSRSPQSNMSNYQVLIQAMKTYGAPVILKLPKANPPVTDRLNAVNRAFKDERGQVRVDIDPSCEELITDLEQVLRDARGGIKKTYNRTDSYFWRTHTSDALGYWIAYDEPATSDIAIAGGLHEAPTTIVAPGYSFIRNK